MRLIAIYIGEYGLFKDQLLTFSSDYNVTKISSDGDDTLSFKMEHTKKLPDYFFSTQCLQRECVSSVSAIIGQNGSGKTTIARLLCQIASLDSDLGRNVLLIVEVCGKLRALKSGEGDKICVSLDGVEVECESFKEIKDFTKSLMSIKGGGEQSQINSIGKVPFKFFYYSPHYTTEQSYWDISEDGDTAFNISTTWLMHHPEGNSETLLHEGVSHLRIFDVDEKIRVFDFCEAYRRELQSEGSTIDNGRGHDNIPQSDDQIRFDIPTPQLVSITPYTEGITQAIKELSKFVEKKQREELGVSQSMIIMPDISETALHDPLGNFIKSLVEYLENALSCSDFFTRVLIAYVARYLQECGIIGSNFPEVEILPGSYLSALKSFIMAHESHKAIDPKEVITFFKANIPPLNGETDKGNNRGRKTPYPYARDFFECLFKICELQGKKDADGMPLVLCFAGGEMKCLLSNAEVQGRIDELVRLHGLTEIFSPFLTFDILPKMSSGEMAFLSMFARMYRFVGKKTKPGDDVMIFLDEAETTLHPEWQRKLVGYFIRFFEVFIPHRHYQLIFASHSPTLLSDIPVGNCCFLDAVNVEENGIRKKYAISCKFRSTDESRNTFGANIYDLFHNAFFMDNGSIGEFSSMVIRRYLKRIAAQALRCDKKNAEGITGVADNENELIQTLIGDRVLIRYFNVLKDQGLI